MDFVWFWAGDIVRHNIVWGEGVERGSEVKYFAELFGRRLNEAAYMQQTTLGKDFILSHCVANSVICGIVWTQTERSGIQATSNAWQGFYFKSFV